MNALVSEYRTGLVAALRNALSDANHTIPLGARLAQVKQVFGPAWNAVATRYRAGVFKELAGYGLRYDDLYDPLKDEVGSLYGDGLRQHGWG